MVFLIDGGVTEKVGFPGGEFSESVVLCCSGGRGCCEGVAWCALGEEGLVVD